MILLSRIPRIAFNPLTSLNPRYFSLPSPTPDAFPDVPTAAYYDHLVNTAGRERDLEKVRYLLNKRVRDCCFNTTKTFDFITDDKSSSSILEDLYHTLARLDEGFARKSAHDSLIARFCKLKRTDEALRVIDIMSKGGFGLNACSFHPILSVLTRGKQMEEAWRVMELMREVKISPDVTAYNHLLTAYCFEGNLTAAADVLKKMEENGLAADGRTYDALVLGACKAGKVEGAFVVLGRMVDEGQTAYYSTYSHVIGALLKLGCYTQAVKFVMICGKRDAKLDSEIFGSLASRFISLQRIDEAKFILEEMGKRGLEMRRKLREFYELNVKI